MTATLNKSEETLTFNSDNKEIKIPWEFSALIAMAYIALFGIDEMNVVS